MGLPEIVDFARNFAVMVRVQGPDPKGLKMRKHAFHLYNCGKTTLSASGMLLPGSFCLSPADKHCHDMQSLTLVVTVASVVEPFLSLEHRKSTSQDKPQLIPGVQIDVMLEGKKGALPGNEGLDGRAPDWLSAQLLALADVSASSMAVQSLIQASAGSFDSWEVGWSLAMNSDAPQHSVDATQSQRKMDMVGGGFSSQNLISMSTAKLAILGVYSTMSKDLPNLNISPSIKRGDVLLALGSPFGVLSPVHFFNSISLGSVANCYPSGSAMTSLLMADIRCLPGMEGGPVFGEDASLIGILTRPLKQKTSGAEIQLVIPWEAIAAACSDLLQEEAQSANKGINYNNVDSNPAGRLYLSRNPDLNGLSIHHHENLNSSQSPIEKAMSSVCLVTIDDGMWASGVLLNDDGLILTNAHLLEPWRFQKATRNVDGGEGNKVNRTTMQRRIHVRLDHRDHWIWCDARVVYVSKGPLDIALLQLEFVPGQLCPVVVDFTCPSPGSKVYVIGHGLFGPRCEFSPSVCIGIVAKVVEAKGPLPYRTSQHDIALEHLPAMLETTAAVHPGGSGGAVVNLDGHMIGLVTSNARHGGGTTIPHLNFSIPCAALKPIFDFSKVMQDFSLLEDLDRPNDHLSSVWALMPPLSPKPGPSLPNVQRALPGDINKDGKGSRFAKFIEETQEVFKKSTQLGKMEKLSYGFITPSKL